MTDQQPYHTRTTTILRNALPSRKHTSICSLLLTVILLCSFFCCFPHSASAGNNMEHASVSKTDAPDDSVKTSSQIAADKTNSSEVHETSGPVSETIGISAPSALLMEVSTGTVIYEKDADTSRAPASVTKIMTMLLIFDALHEGTIQLEDTVTTSEYAASMGGSQIFLEPGEIQTVDTMLKCIAVASANDACVAMAEHIAGSEPEFVNRMNERAKQLGMNNTTFINCNGLDAEGHKTSPRDIALMSAELLSSYPEVHNYCTIWMENITHTTAKGSSEFGLTNTNKLIRQYEYATGLKTGSTGDAGFCVSASAEKNGIELVAVIMGADTSKDRFRDAVTLLNYGFGKCQIYRDETPEPAGEVRIRGGVEDSADTEYDSIFTWVDTEGNDLKKIESKTELPKEMDAPIKKGDVVGHLVYTLDGKEIGRINIVSGSSVKEAHFKDYFLKSIKAYASFSTIFNKVDY